MAGTGKYEIVRDLIDKEIEKQKNNLAMDFFERCENIDFDDDSELVSLKIAKSGIDIAREIAIGIIEKLI